MLDVMMDGEWAPITSFSRGCEVIVCGLASDAALRLRDIGLREGARVTIHQNVGNIIVRAAGCRIGIRPELAVTILAKRA